MVEHVLAKDEAGVRFSSAAQNPCTALGDGLMVGQQSAQSPVQRFGVVQG